MREMVVETGYPHFDRPTKFNFERSKFCMNFLLASTIVLNNVKTIEIILYVRDMYAQIKFTLTNKLSPILSALKAS